MFVIYVKQKAKPALMALRVLWEIPLSNCTKKKRKSYFALKSWKGSTFNSFSYLSNIGSLNNCKEYVNRKLREISIIDPCQDSKNKSIGQTAIESGSKLETMAGPMGFEPMTFSLEG
jgi:hypothetical protein